MEALAIITEPVALATGCYELDDNSEEGPSRPLGQLIAIAFDASLEEMSAGVGSIANWNAWYDGPLKRFSKHFFGR